MLKFIQFSHTSYLGIGYLRVNIENLSNSIDMRINQSFPSIPLNLGNQNNQSADILLTDVEFLPYIFNGAQIGSSNYRDLTNGDLNTGKIKLLSYYY